jgi:hypothetical protein
MRFESATVPAAVMPDRSCDDGFKKYLPLSASRPMGRLLGTGISQKTCQTKIFNAFGSKSKESLSDSNLFNSRQQKTEIDFEKRCFLYCSYFLNESAWTDLFTK